MEPDVDPRRYRAAAESVGFHQRDLEGGEVDRQLAVPADAVIHAEWMAGTPRRPPLGLMATVSHEHHEAWCGVRVRMILPETFNPGSVRACPACLDAFHRGYPEALLRQ